MAEEYYDLPLVATGPMLELLNALAARHNQTVSQVIRSAIALLKCISDAELAGEIPVLINLDSGHYRRLVGWQSGEGDDEKPSPDA